MTESAKKRTAYRDLFHIPENATGEIINGELIVPGVYANSAKVRAEPFPDIELDLGLLWLE